VSDATPPSVNQVSVFDAAAQHYEYINCHPNTGLMRAA
jgi:aldoxime dehydratase